MNELLLGALAIVVVIVVVVLYYHWHGEGLMVAPNVSDWLAGNKIDPHITPQGPSLLPIPLPGGLMPGQIVKCSATAIRYFIDPAGVKRKFQTPAAFLAAGGETHVQEVNCDLLNAIPTGPDMLDPAIYAQSRMNQLQSLR